MEGLPNSHIRFVSPLEASLERSGFAGLRDRTPTLMESMKLAKSAAPALALVKCMFKNRESCRIAVDEKLDFMKPDLVASNAAFEACCRQLKSLSDAENVIKHMAVLGVKPDESSFGFAILEEMEKTRVSALVKGFIESQSLKSLATLIIEAQKSEPLSIDIDRSVGFGIINACVNLGFSDKAHSILEEMIAQGE